MLWGMKKEPHTNSYACYKLFRNQGETFSPSALVYNQISSAMLFKLLAKIFQTFPRSFILGLNL